MFEILEKTKLAENTFEMKILAPDIAKKAEPGQFIILRIDEKGERIPLTIADFDDKSVTIVFLTLGYTTKKLSKLNKGEFLKDFVGPLGIKSDVKKYGKVCLVGGGLGIAPIYPIARKLKELGNEITIIIGAKSKDYLFWQDRFEKLGELIICTDDGSLGRKGFVSEALKEVDCDLVIAIGPPIMMKVVSEISNVKTLVSLNPIMVDAMGMCGCCRIVIDGKVKFACVDGPEFDAAKIDWDELMDRNLTYKKEEEHKCKVIP